MLDQIDDSFALLKAAEVNYKQKYEREFIVSDLKSQVQKTKDLNKSSKPFIRVSEPILYPTSGKKDAFGPNKNILKQQNLSVGQRVATLPAEPQSLKIPTINVVQKIHQGSNQPPV